MSPFCRGSSLWIEGHGILGDVPMSVRLRCSCFSKRRLWVGSKGASYISICDILISFCPSIHSAIRSPTHFITHPSIHPPISLSIHTYTLLASCSRKALKLGRSGFKTQLYHLLALVPWARYLIPLRCWAGQKHLMCLCESHSVVSNSLWSHGLYTPWISLGQNTGMGSLSLLWGSYQPRDWTQLSCIAGRFLTSWATREAKKHFIEKPKRLYWVSGQPNTFFFRKQELIIRVFG